VASLAQRLPDNVPGDFFVDDTCIDCDACRIFAPAIFSDAGDKPARERLALLEQMRHAIGALIKAPPRPY